MMVASVVYRKPRRRFMGNEKCRCKVKVEMRCLFASGEFCPPAILITLSQDGLAEVREVVAGNPSTPVEVLVTLSTDEDSDVRTSVAGNPSTPVEALVTLSTDKDEYVRSGVAGNPSTPVEVLVKLSADEDARSSVAGNPSTPVEVLVKLSADEGVRGLLAGNPSTPVEVLVTLSTDEDEFFVRSGVAGNPSTPVEALMTLSTDKDEDVRRSVAGNPSTPVEVLVSLSTDKDEFVRRSVAGNPSTPVEVLVTLSADENVRGYVAGNPSTPLEVLMTLSESTDWNIEGLINNPRTPAETISDLFSKYESNKPKSSPFRDKYSEIVSDAKGSLHNGDSGYRPENDTTMSKWLIECGTASDFQPSELTDFFTVVGSYLETIDWTCDSILWSMTEAIHKLEPEIFTQSKRVFLTTLIECAEKLREMTPLCYMAGHENCPPEIVDQLIKIFIKGLDDEFSIDTDRDDAEEFRELGPVGKRMISKISESLSESLGDRGVVALLNPLITNPSLTSKQKDQIIKLLSKPDCDFSASIMTILESWQLDKSDQLALTKSLSVGAREIVSKKMNGDSDATPTQKKKAVKKKSSPTSTKVEKPKKRIGKKLAAKKKPKSK